MYFINTLEESLSNSLGSKVEFNKIYEPIKPGDVHKTYASTNELYKLTKFKPETLLKDGLTKFSNWYSEYINYKNKDKD